MTKRDAKILMAAFSAFSRYGVAKTTMNDVARQAGVARQTVYNTYASKDDLLRATVQFIGDKAFDDMMEAWRSAHSLGEKIEAFFQMGPISWYDMVQASPDAADLLEGIHDAAEAELAKIADKWVAAWTDVLNTATSHHTNATPEAREIAEFLYSTSINAKYNTPNREVLLERLKVLRLSVLALVGEQ